MRGHYIRFPENVNRLDAENKKQKALRLPAFCHLSTAA
jgi:hypothetical protein